MITVPQFIALLIVVFGIPAVVAAWNFTKRVGAERKAADKPSNVGGASPGIDAHSAASPDYNDHFTSDHSHDLLMRIARGETI